jgi:glutathione synthase/RimK-type ligase-like ATP-grasp enzyme
MSIVIFGETDDFHVNAVAECLSDDVIIIDDEALTTDISIAADIHGRPDVYLGDLLLKPTSIYWRNLNLYPFGTKEDDEINNKLAAAKLFTQAFADAAWLNPVIPFTQHFTKIDQYRMANTLMPPTLMTNNYDRAEAFIAEHGDVAVKPIAGGEYIERITSLDELPEWVDGQPVCYQKFIVGTNVRTFVIGEEVYTADITTDYDDFRVDEDFIYTPTESSPALRKRALDITRRLGYKWTAIDWIRTEDELYFLEANFSPMFLYFEEQTEFPISQSLASKLV